MLCMLMHVNTLLQFCLDRAPGMFAGWYVIIIFNRQPDLFPLRLYSTRQFEPMRETGQWLHNR